jgi:hypothetical protein
MLALIAETLTERDIKLEKVTTEIRRGKDGQKNFVVEVDCTFSHYMDHEHVQQMVKELSALKPALELDILDVRVQRLKNQTQ